MNKVKLILLLLLACLIFVLISCPNPGERAQAEPAVPTDPGQLYVEMDPKTGSFSMAYGWESRLAAGAVKQFLNEQKSLLNIDPANLELVSERTSSLKAQRYVTYRQLYKGIPVYGSYVGYTVKADGTVPLLGAKYFPDIDIDVAPSLSGAGARALAGNRSAALAAGEISIKDDPELMVLPVEREDKYGYTLVYRVKAEAKRFSRTFLIDAASGKVVKDFSNIRNEASGQVKMQYYSPNPNGQIKEYAGWGGGQVIMHSFSSDIGYRAYYATCNLDGRYYFPESGFINYVQADLGPGALTNAWASIEGSITPESHFDLTFNWTWTISPAGNLFVRMTKMHDYFSQFTTACNYAMPAEITWDESTAAGADGYMLHFGYYSGRMWELADDVIYHEYSHNIIYRAMGGRWFSDGGSVQGLAMDEGTADYFACSNSQDAVIGEYYDTPATPSRNLYNKRSWDPDPTVPGHTNGMAIGGACWDLRRYLGQAMADRLVLEAIEMSPQATTFEEFARNVALADDNDGNLRNGVPHGYNINRAFETNHKINFPWY